MRPVWGATAIEFVTIEVNVFQSMRPLWGRKVVMDLHILLEHHFNLCALCRAQQ